MKSGTNSASATSPTIVSQIRGDTYSDAALSNGQHVWTGGLESWIKASNGIFVPYILSQNATHYVVDNKEAPFSINKNNCIVTIYDNSGTIASNPSVLISKEFWNVGFMLPSSPNWTSVDMSNVSCTISVTTNASGIFFDTTKSFPVGNLNVVYAKRTNTSHLESFPTVINTDGSSSYYIKPIEQQTGINADSMSTDSATFSTTKILSQSNMSKTNTLLINKGSKSFAIGVQGSFNNLNNMTVTKTASGFNLSSDFGNNITPLATAQSFTVDPTYGYTSSSNLFSQYGTQNISGTCGWSSGTDSGGSGIVVDIPTSSSNSACYDVTAQWDTSSIPSNSVITTTTIQYDISLQLGSSPPNCNWYPITNKPSTATAATRVVDSQNGTAYVTDTGCTTTGTGKTKVLGSSANSDLHNLLPSGWFGLGSFYTTQTRGSTEFLSKYANLQLQIVYTPGAPTGLTTPTQSTTAITPRWSSVAGATWYLLDRESPTGHGFSQITNTTSLSFADTGLAAGTQYNYEIFAGASGGAGPASAPSSNYTNQVAPTALTFTGIKTTTARITWTNPSGNFTGFKIEKESPTGGGFSTLVANTGNNTNHYDLTSLAQGTQYNIRISTVYGAIPSVSSPSTASSTWTSAVFPETINFTGSNTFTNGIILNGNITAPNGFCIGAC